MRTGIVWSTGPRGHPAGRATRRLLPLALIFLAVGLSTAVALPFQALFLTEAVHADATRTGIFLAAAPVSGVVVSTLVGRLSDRFAVRRALLVVTAAAGCVGSAVTAVVRDYRVLLIVTVTVAGVAGALMPQAFAYARESLEGSERVAVVISGLRSLFSVAWVAGPPLAAALLHLGGFTVVYAAAGAMYAVAALVAVALPRLPAASGVVPAAAGPDVAGPDTAAPGGAGPGLLLWATLLAFVLTRCTGTLNVQGLPLFTTRELGGAVGDAGLLLGLCAALEIPFMIGFGVLAARVRIHRLLVIGAACGLAYPALVTVATSTWQLIAGQLLNAASIAALTGLGITYVQDLLPRHPGRASTLFSNTFAAGGVLAGPVIGLAQDAGYRMPYAVGAVLGTLALALLVAVSSGFRRDQRPLP
jgi:MFS transporter, SET family, sugar efflux transporter